MNGNNREAEKQVLALANRDELFSTILQKALNEALEERMKAFLCAGNYERIEGRKGYRNGSYERQLKTRVGTINLTVCRDRNGAFEHDVFERYERSEKALMLSISEMYFSGVATRKVSDVLETLCGTTISKSTVSELTKKLDVDLHQWRTRSLHAKKYRYLVVDARYEKIRENGQVISKACAIIVGIDDDGFREILGCYVVNSESNEGWDHCFADLKNRDLHGVQFVVSDENRGLRNALSKHFQGVLFQRCQVHFMRNFLSKLARNEQAEYMSLLRDVFAAATEKDAKEQVKKLTQALTEKRKHKLAQWIDEHIEESLVVLQLQKEHHKKMKSTNMLERLNQEVKRRSRSIRIFPNEDSCLRLLTALCQETSESWESKRYLDMFKPQQEEVSQ
jgi:transposase-like protein